MFNEEIAQLAIKEIKATGVPVVDGLSIKEIAQIESLLGAAIPPDLKTFFKVGIPVINDAEDKAPFPDWHGNLDELVAEMKTSVEQAFIYDIEHDDYWHKSFGERPEDTDKAKEQALGVIRSWPPLIRVYAHRFMPTSPSTAGNPVISVWQASDTVYYGNDLAHYLQNEFEIQLPLKSPDRPASIPLWGDVFDLANERS